MKEIIETIEILPLDSYKNPCQKRILDQLYKNRNKTGDVKFIVESEEILAHRCVLAALSPKYEAQFYGSQPDSGDIKVEDVSAAAFAEFLQFFYTEHVTFTIENIEDVLNLAEQSLVTDLVELCSKFLLDTIKVERISTYLRLARLYNLEEVQEKCDDLIYMNIQEIFKSDDFLEYERDTLVYILKMDTWNYKEAEAFEHCMEWARAECRRQNNDATKVENIRAAFGDAFYNIRFGLMTIEEFAAIDKQHTDLFTKAELRELIQKIGKVKETDSNLFNNNLRFPPYFSCTTIEEGPSESFIPSDEGDSIEFSCHKAINLYGFMMNAGPCDDFDVDIHDGNNWLGLLGSHPKTIRKLNEHFEVMFNEPIEILPEQKYKEAEIRITFPKNDAQMGYIPLQKTKQNGFHFEFEKLFLGSRTTICQLLFNRTNLVKPEN